MGPPVVDTMGDGGLGHASGALHRAPATLAERHEKAEVRAGAVLSREGMAMAPAAALRWAEAVGEEHPRRARRVVASVESLEAATDQALMAEIANGSEPALAHVYNTHAGPVFGMARRILGDIRLAEDVVQEVFVRLWDRPEAFDASRGSLRSYLVLHARSRSLDTVRSDGSRRSREGVQGRMAIASTRQDGPEAAVTAGEEIAHVRRAVGNLSNEQRQVIEMAYFEGRTCRQIADLLGLPEGTVKSRMRLGLQRLRHVLAEVAG